MGRDCLKFEPAPHVPALRRPTTFLKSEADITGSDHFVKVGGCGGKMKVRHRLGILGSMATVADIGAYLILRNMGVAATQARESTPNCRMKEPTVTTLNWV